MITCNCSTKDIITIPVKYKMDVENDVLMNFIFAHTMFPSLKKFNKFELYRSEHECAKNGEEFFIECKNSDSEHTQLISKTSFKYLMIQQRLKINE
jgi:hypothetical protein